MIDVTGDTRPFFKSLLEESLRDMRVRLSPEVEVYVVYLLDEMGRTSYSEEPLGIKMLSSVYPERIGVLKEVGDRSLFVSGFFEERLVARGLSRSYYASLASSAYGELAARFREPFRSMATSTTTLQRVLMGVRDACDAMGMDLWAAHERWLRTRSPALERRMADLGVFSIRETKARG